MDLKKIGPNPQPSGVGSLFSLNDSFSFLLPSQDCWRRGRGYLLFRKLPLCVNFMFSGIFCRISLPHRFPNDPFFESQHRDSNYPKQLIISSGSCVLSRVFERYVQKQSDFQHYENFSNRQTHIVALSICLV